MPNDNTTRRGGWVYVGRADADQLIASLYYQIERPTRRKRGAKSKKSSAPNAPSAIYQLKVTLLGARPSIWRRVQVPDAMPLSRIHGVLQIVMGWTNSHLHQFIADGRYYALRSPVEYPDVMEVTDERTTSLNQVAPKVQSRIFYEYDFGDSWEHELVVEKILTPEPDVEYPRCLDGKRACPPDNVGGVWGYHDFQKAIRNPKHPEHEEMLEWVGGHFDPEAFDLHGVNGLLTLYPSWM